MRTDSEQTRLPAFSSSLVGLSIVISVAAYFRLHRLNELLIFATDQGRAMLAGRNILLGELILTGPPTSVDGFHLGPLYYYLTALALAFSRFDPLGPAIMTALLGIAGAAALFWLTKRYFNSTTGLLAGLLFAISPLAAAQSRIAIEPTPLPFVTIIWLYSLIRWLETNSRGWFIATIGLVLVGVQLNFSAIVMIPIMLTAWLILDRRTVEARKHALIWSGGALLMSLQLYKSLLGPQTDPVYLGRVWQELTTPQHWFPASIVLAVALVGFWQLLIRARQKEVSAVVVICWLILSSWSFLLKNVSGDHSLAILFAAPAVLTAIGLGQWLKRIKQLGWLILIPLFLLFANGTTRYIFNRTDLTLNDHQIVADKVIELSRGEAYNFIYRGHLDVYDSADDHYQYLLWLSGHPPVESARISLEPAYIEPWLLQRGFAQRTIILYYPDFEADRYLQVGYRQAFNGVIIETIDQ